MLWSGILFVKENISKLEDGDDVHTTLGFEILFPALLERARNLGIEGLPYDDPTTQKICAARDLKLDRYIYIDEKNIYIYIYSIYSIYREWIK